MEPHNDDGIQLSWPEPNSTEDVISALKNEDRLDKLVCHFMDDARYPSYIISKELQDALISFKSSPSFNVKAIRTFEIHNNCDSHESKKRYLDLFLKYIQCTGDSTTNIVYAELSPFTRWTLAEAQKVASTIASISDPHLCLDLSGGNIFGNKGTFECVFNEILNGGMVDEFAAGSDFFLDLKHGCIGRSNLATNTTLKRLQLYLWNGFIIRTEDEGIEQLANALKTNQGLVTLSFQRGIVSNVGRRKLLESLRDNITVLSLDTASVDNDNDSTNCEEVLRLEGGIEGRVLQLKINEHMKLNKFWKNLEKHRSRPISHKIYPDVLEEVGKKPLLLYKFLRERDQSQLFGTFYNNNDNICLSSPHSSVVKQQSETPKMNKRRKKSVGGGNRNEDIDGLNINWWHKNSKAVKDGDSKREWLKDKKGEWLEDGKIKAGLKDEIDELRLKLSREQDRSVSLQESLSRLQGSLLQGALP